MTRQQHDAEPLRLVRKAQAYDDQALSKLCQLLFEDVYSYFYYRARDAANAQDLTNDVFLRMVESIRSFDPGRGSFRAWLFSIAHHWLVDHRRRQAVRDHEPLTEALATSDDHPSAQAEAWLTRERLRQALRGLTEDQRQVIVLKFIEGLSNAEVGQVLGKSEGAINALQYRGLQALRQMLKAEDGG